MTTKTTYFCVRCQKTITKYQRKLIGKRGLCAACYKAVLTPATVETWPTHPEGTDAAPQSSDPEPTLSPEPWKPRLRW